MHLFVAPFTIMDIHVHADTTVLIYNFCFFVPRSFFFVDIIGTVHGVFNSVAGVGGAVSDTVSILTFDQDYRMKREREKNKAMAKQGGVGEGFLQVRVFNGVWHFVWGGVCCHCWFGLVWFGWSNFSVRARRGLN